MTRTFTTNADLRDQIGLILDEGADGRDAYDLDGIVTEIGQTIGLPSRVEQDEDGAWVWAGDTGSVDTDTFWAIVAHHDTTQA